MKIPYLDKIIDLISNRQSCRIGGLWGSAYVYILRKIIQKNTPVSLLITPTIEEFESALEDLSTFLGASKDNLYYFPFSETDENNIEPDVARARIKTLNLLIGSNLTGKIIITPIQAIMQKIPSPSSLQSSFISLHTGDNLDTIELTEQLTSHEFIRIGEVSSPGEFSIRGGIIDIFAFDLLEPVRIELVGNKIESLRTFNPSDQLSYAKLNDITLCLSRLGQDNSYLLDYLPSNTLIIRKEPTLITEISQSFNNALMHKLNSSVHLDFQTLPLRTNETGSFNFQINSLQRFSGNLTGLANELTTLYEKGLAITIFCRHQSEINRLNELLIYEDNKKSPKIELKLGQLNTGFIFPEISRAFVNYNELFNRYHQPRRFRLASEAGKSKAESLEPFLELEKGDFVVHLKYGIGRYRGIEQIEKNGYTQEYLVLEYQNRAKVYVPIHQANLIEKYIAGSDRPPELNKLGTDLWEIRKERVKKSVTQFAREFLETQAIRETQSGIAFPQDTDWQKEFESSFPYEETPDQLNVNEVINKDMTSPHPMDRLICGDVGYGKTELAMRAAFKAATAGYQVAILVPTTILAQQHYQTFRERMADYPVNIEMLSRFRTKQEQQAIVKGLREGEVDIIIGTHRLLQSDIQLKNPGLIIIDEEQRFGVEHKERLKKLKTIVDTLTLTATPIPRTLHLSLLGIRDISNLTTPPLDRRAVVTQIIPFDESVMQQAIRRELNRQGQIYFVHNRIYDIETIARRIKTIVPEASTVIAHGQLPENELEEQMKQFIEGKIDILVSTNIIESGLDIPRANTIFINHADNFGLSDLHQLRGRVGRYKHQAYAYLIVPDKPIAYDATKRLKAITEFNELGAGFKIALRDMEIRGVGNILGREQHGHITSIGYGLYCKLLENAVKILKATTGGKVSHEISAPDQLETTIELRINAYLPIQYIPDEKQRMNLYRRLSKITKPEELIKIRTELLDRFGSLIPKEVENLMDIVRIKLLAQKYSFISLVQPSIQTQDKGITKGDTDNAIVVHYLNLPKAKKVQQRHPDTIHIVDDKTLYITLPDQVIHNQNKIIDLLKDMLQ